MSMIFLYLSSICSESKTKKTIRCIDGFDLKKAE